MAQTKITFDNANQFGAGTTVEFDFGAYYATCEGTVKRVEYRPENRWEDAHAVLIAEYEDEDGKTVETEIRAFTDVGIGVYLIEAKQVEVKKSKWAA